MRAHASPLGCSSARRRTPRSQGRTMLATRRRIAPLAFLALTLQLAASPPTSAGLVLCVGSDGHVAVESGGASGCGPLQSPANSCDELGYSAPCSDAALGGSELTSPSPRAGRDASLALTPAFARNPAGITAARALTHATAFVDPSRSQRSATLRL